MHGNHSRLFMANRKTTIEEALPLLRYFKYVGVFPYKIVNKLIQLENGQREAFENLEIDTSWKYTIYQVIIFGYVLTRSGFGAIQIFRKHYLAPELGFNLNIICIFMLIGSLLLVEFSLHSQMKETIQFLNEWHLIESKVRENALNHGFRAQKTNLKWRPYVIVRTYFVIMILGNIVIDILVFVRYPRYELFLYSLQNPNVESTWFKLLSVLELSLFITILIAYNVQFDLLGTGFPCSIKHSICILQVEEYGEEFESNQKSCERFDQFLSNLNVYMRLDSLVTRFNTLYGNELLRLKAIALVAFCFLFYTPVRQPHLINCVSVAIFLNLTGFLLQKMVQVLMQMGRVQKESLKFRGSWMQNLSVGHPMSEKWRYYWIQVLNSTPTIAFTAGSYYSIKSSTILTFFSIATSYVIVALQI